MKSGLEILNLKDIRDIDDLSKREGLIPADVEKKVNKILDDIREGDQETLIDYSYKLDGYKPATFKDFMVSIEEIEEAYLRVKTQKPELSESISKSKKNIEAFHEEQKLRLDAYWSIDSGSAKGTAQKMTPIERIGIYVPGGRFPYPSTVLMTAIPAIIAGSSKISFFTPPDKQGNINDVILFTIRLCGLKEVYKIGGAQAVAVMAYGLGPIEKVDKIVGPGNIYVTAAKKAVFGEVGIDSLAGPSEVLILADSSGVPEYIAADLLSQAEHDPDAKVMLLTDNRKLADRCIDAIEDHIMTLSEKYKQRFNSEAVLKTLQKNCIILYDKDMEELIRASNMIAPEHLEIMVREPEKMINKIDNAGAIFIGDYSPVAIGDYYCGTNHVIPTRGNSRFSSPLGVSDFVKRSSIAFYGNADLKSSRRHIEIFSDTENLLAHKESVRKRFDRKG